MAPSFNTIFDESDVCFQFGACGRYMYNKNRKFRKKHYFCTQKFII